MGMKDYRLGAGLILVFVLVCIVLSIVGLPAWVRAAPLDLPPRPVTPTPTASPTAQPTPGPRRAAQTRGALVELRVQFPDVELAAHWQRLWTVVQWQDAQGKWHDVEGWRGALDGMQGGAGRKVWWLADNLFGGGPFRWLVFQEKDGKLLAGSEVFFLPQAAGETTRLEVLLAP